MSNANEPKVIGTWRNKDGLNLRVVVKPQGRYGDMEYVLERRNDNDKDAMGVERWLEEDIDEDSRTYDLLRWLGGKLGQ